MSEELKKLLGDDLYSQVSSLLADNTVTLVPKGQKAFLHKESETPVISNNGEWVPSSKLSELTEAKKALADQNAELNTALETLKKDNKGNEELTSKISELQTNLEKNKTEAAKLEKKYVLRDHLRDAQVKTGYIDLLENKFDLEKIEVSEGKIKDFENLLNPIKENYKELFGEEKLEGGTPPNGGGKPEDIYSMDEIKAMSQSEVATNLDKVNQSMEFHSKN
jgi:hypothetical protein